MMGRRLRMEDACVAIRCFRGRSNEAFFAVIDAHAGSDVAEEAAVELATELATQLGDGPLPAAHSEVTTAMSRAYLAINERMKPKRVVGGAVAVAILLDFKSEGGRAVVHCANVGDARAVLCREHGGVRLSRDFKPFDDDEYRDPRTRPPHTTRREPLPVEYYRSASPTTAGTIASCLSAASYHCATGVASATTSRSRGRSATSTLRGTLSPSRIATRSRLTSSTARSSRSAATGCGTSSRTNRRWMPSSRPPRSTNAAPRRFATLRSCTGRQTTSAAATATSRRRHHLN